VTSFLYRAHPVSTVLGGLIAYTRDQAGAVIRHYRDFMATAPDELTAYAGVISMPDGTPAVGLMVCYCGDPADGERVLKPLRAFGPPALDAIQPMPFQNMQKLAGDLSPDGTHNYLRSTFLKELSDEVIDLIVEHGNRVQSPLSRIVIQFFGGAVGRVGPADTAFAQRQAEYYIGIESEWTDAAESEKHIGWTRTLSDALKPYSSGGYLLNFLGDEEPKAIRAAFGSNYARLVKLKTKYDPSNFFSLNQNVAPMR
jgi:Berberine and berberine like